MKTRSAFYLQTTITTKLSRKLCRSVIKSKKAARQPSYAISLTAVKAECKSIFKNFDRVESNLNFLIAVAVAFQKIPLTDIKSFLKYKRKDRGSVTMIANRLGNPGSTGCEWLKLTPKENMPIPEKVAFPKPPKGPDGSLLYERIPNKNVVEPEKFVVPNTIGCTIITPTNLSVPQNSTTNNSTTPASTLPLPASVKRRVYDMNGMDRKF